MPKQQHSSRLALVGLAHSAQSRDVVHRTAGRKSGSEDIARANFATGREYATPTERRTCWQEALGRTGRPWAIGAWGVILAVLLALRPTEAWASPIVVQTNAFYDVYTQSGLPTMAGHNSLSISASGVDSYVDYSVIAASSFGVLRGSAFISSTVVTPGVYPAYVESGSTFQDSMTFSWSGGVPGVSTGSVQLGMYITATASDGVQQCGIFSCVEEDNSLQYIINNYVGVVDFTPVTNNVVTGSGIGATGSFSGQVFGAVFPVVDGVPVQIEMSIAAFAELYCGSLPGNPTCGNGSGAALTDAYDTAVLNSITLVDANGNPIPGFTIASGSGASYTANGVAPVPEPSGLLLVASGLGLVAKRLRRSKGRGLVACTR